MEFSLEMIALGVVIGLALGATAVVILRRRARARKRPRVVEAPNSHYQSRGVVNLIDQDRWERIRMDRLHEINRDEVRALLRRVRADGARALSPADRAFLDRMAVAAGTTPSKSPGASGGGILPPTPTPPAPSG